MNDTHLIFPGIKIYDNVLKLFEVNKIRHLILETPMVWNGRDKAETPINTLTKEFDSQDTLFLKLKSIIHKTDNRFDSLKFIRAGINLIMPQSIPSFFHKDHEKIVTCLFYINPDLNLDEGGETQFNFDEYLIGIRPRPGRLIFFDGAIEHRTTYFRTETRITIYFKYLKNPNVEIF